MKLRHQSLGRQRGAAAVELAIILPIMILMLVFFTFFARYFWHYTVAQKAAYDSARYLSTISEQEMREPTLATAARDIAEDIVLEEIAELRPNDSALPEVNIVCGDIPCRGVRGFALPPTVSVNVNMDMHDFLGLDLGRYGLGINVTARVRYVGN